MRKFLKDSILEILKTMYEAHKILQKSVGKKEYENAQGLLADCQNTAIQLGELIEGSEGEGIATISYIEEYCEALYEISVNLSEETNGNKIQKQLDKKMLSIESSVKNDIKVKLEIVFMPYKASMWDSLESIWKAADEDPDCDAYVVPIPYYDRKPDHSFGEFHYEGNQYPDYVPVVHYETYNLEQRRPDVIYIHNPYDANNYVTSVDPRFYSDQLKKYTDCLVYVPYYVLHNRISENLACASAVINSDYVFVQNESFVDDYCGYLSNYIPIDTLKQKIISCGSPKIDKIINYEKNMSSYNEQWKEKINGRKVVFFNTNISYLLQKNERFIEELIRVFKIFEKHNENCLLLWREHPLTISTLQSMRPQLLKDYLNLKSYFIKKNIGIIDDKSDAYEAMSISDCYYGSAGSLAVVYGITGKPMLISNYKYDCCSPERKDISLEDFLLSNGKSFLYTERNPNTLELFIENLDKFDENKQQRLDAVHTLIDNYDGTSGEKIHNYIKSHNTINRNELYERYYINR